MKTINPAALVPFAVFNGKAIFQAGAILRLAGSINPSIYGTDNLAKAKVDSFVDLLLNIAAPKIDDVMESV